MKFKVFDNKENKYIDFYKSEYIDRGDLLLDQDGDLFVYESDFGSHILCLVDKNRYTVEFLQEDNMKHKFIELENYYSEIKFYINTNEIILFNSQTDLAGRSYTAIHLHKENLEVKESPNEILRLIEE